MEKVEQYKYPIGHQENERHSNVAVLAPGQDVQRPGMLDEVMKQPAGAEVIERGSELLYEKFGYDILKITAKDADPLILRQTKHTQAAVFLYAMALHNSYKHHDRREGYATLPRYVSGNSMGMVIATTLSGALNFEEGLYLSGMRGQVMQDFGDPTPTEMVAVIGTSEDEIKKLLRKHRRVDLCLINSDSVLVIGGPNKQLQTAIKKLESINAKVKVFDVNTDRAMHGRYVRPALPGFIEVLNQVNFRDPIIPLVGTHTRFPIRAAAGIINELTYGFDHTFNNWEILRFFDKEGIHVISELNEKGTMANIVKRSLGAIAVHRREAGLAAVGLAAAGVIIFEVLTRHHPDKDKPES